MPGERKPAGDEWGDPADTALAFKWLRLSKGEDGHANEPCKDNRTGRNPTLSSLRNLQWEPRVQSHFSGW